jgi:hypothetical protein
VPAPKEPSVDFQANLMGQLKVRNQAILKMKKTNMKSLTYLLQNKQHASDKLMMNRVQSQKVLYNLNRSKMNKNNSSIRTSFSFYEDPFAVKLKKNLAKDNRNSEKKILSGGHWRVNNQMGSTGLSGVKKNSRYLGGEASVKNV